MNTIYLAIAASYILYFMWLISTNEQDTRHAQELADADPESRVSLTVNDYFFADKFEE